MVDTVAFWLYYHSLQYRSSRSKLGSRLMASGVGLVLNSLHGGKVTFRVHSSVEVNTKHKAGAAKSDRIIHSGEVNTKMNLFV